MCKKLIILFLISLCFTNNSFSEWLFDNFASHEPPVFYYENDDNYVMYTGSIEPNLLPTSLTGRVFVETVLDCSANDFCYTYGTFEISNIYWEDVCFSSGGNYTSGEHEQYVESHWDTYVDVLYIPEYTNYAYGYCALSLDMVGRSLRDGDQINSNSTYIRHTRGVGINSDFDCFQTNTTHSINPLFFDISGDEGDGDCNSGILQYTQGDGYTESISDSGINELNMKSFVNSIKAVCYGSGSGYAIACKTFNVNRLRKLNQLANQTPLEAFVGRNLSGWGDHLNTVKNNLENDLGIPVTYFDHNLKEKEFDLNKNGISRRILYIFAHGKTFSEDPGVFKAVGLIEGDNYDGDLFPYEIGNNLLFQLIFLNGCHTADTDSGSNTIPFAEKLGMNKWTSNRSCYFGWLYTINQGTAAGFGRRFFEHLDGNNTISYALTEATKDTDGSGGKWRTLGNTNMRPDKKP